MLERAEVPFEFFGCIGLRLMLGLKAETEKELAGLIRLVPLDSIYYHTCGLLLRHRYRWQGHFPTTSPPGRQSR